MPTPYDIIIKVINHAEDSRYKGKSYRGEELTMIIDLSVSSEGFLFYLFSACKIYKEVVKWQRSS